MISRTALRRRSAITLVLAIACAASGAGCYRYRLYQVGGPGGREAGNQPGTEWKEKTLHSFFWGAIRQDVPVDNCHSLGTVVTLGIWAPIKVRWRCAKPSAPGGVLR
jgi:hypothetical protein